MNFISLMLIQVVLPRRTTTTTFSDSRQPTDSKLDISQYGGGDILTWRLRNVDLIRNEGRILWGYGFLFLFFFIEEGAVMKEFRKMVMGDFIKEKVLPESLHFINLLPADLQVKGSHLLRLGGDEAWGWRSRCGIWELWISLQQRRERRTQNRNPSSSKTSNGWRNLDAWQRKPPLPLPLHV